MTKRRLVRRALTTFLTVVSVVGIAGVLAGQSGSPHVFLVTTYRAHPGQEDAYNRALNEHARPVLDEAVSRGVVVSYQFLQQAVGAGENTHIVIIELPSWAAVGTLDEEEGKIAEELFGQPYAEWVSVFPPLRERLRSEVYVSP